jgi:hypothetical protein
MLFIQGTDLGLGETYTTSFTCSDMLTKDENRENGASNDFKGLLVRIEIRFISQ